MAWAIASPMHPSPGPGSIPGTAPPGVVARPAALALRALAGAVCHWLRNLGFDLGPASHCGIAGLRPTYGRVSRHGAPALSWSLDKLGPLGLTADDCGLVLEAIAGADPSTRRLSTNRIPILLLPITRRDAGGSACSKASRQTLTRPCAAILRKPSKCWPRLPVSRRLSNCSG